MTSCGSGAALSAATACLVARIDFQRAGFLDDDLRLVIAQPVDLVRDLVRLSRADDDADQFLAAERDMRARWCATRFA